jgi:uncharacterized protein (DUF433 family)
LLILFTEHPKGEADYRVDRKSWNLQCCDPAVVRDIPFRVFSSIAAAAKLSGYLQLGILVLHGAFMNWKDHIEVNPAVLVGKPIIKGTRISVELILDRVADGWTMEEVLAAYPHVKREDVLAALSFASELFKEETFVAVGKVTA